MRAVSNSLPKLASSIHGTPTGERKKEEQTSERKQSEAYRCAVLRDAPLTRKRREYIALDITNGRTVNFLAVQVKLQHRPNLSQSMKKTNKTIVSTRRHQTPQAADAPAKDHRNSR